MLDYLIALVRMKLVAILLGPSGVGVVNLLQSVAGPISTLTGLGINSSGVREIAATAAANEKEKLAIAVVALRRLVWVTGITGLFITLALAYPLSFWLFGTYERALSVSGVGLTVLLGAISGGQTALLQGTRRIREMAAAGVIASALSTILALAIYYMFQERGIVAVLIGTSLITLVVNWLIVRRIEIPKVPLSHRNTIRVAGPFISLGLPFMWSALLAGLVALIVRSQISGELGLDSVGVFAAAWSLSGMLAGFVLQAMSSDFYPRLTAVSTNNSEVNKMVNEQIEVACLLAIPALLLTLAISPWIVQLLYSHDFYPAAKLMPFLICGVFFQVIAFPLGFIQQAKGKSAWIFVSQTEANLLLLLLSVVLLKKYNLVGCAIAPMIMYSIHYCITLAIARHLSGFQFEPAKLRTVCLSFIFIFIAFFVIQLQERPIGSTIIIMMAIVFSFYSVRNIITQLPSDHRIRQLFPLCRRIEQHD